MFDTLRIYFSPLLIDSDPPPNFLFAILLFSDLILLRQTHLLPIFAALNNFFYDQKSSVYPAYSCDSFRMQ